MQLPQNGPSFTVRLTAAGGRGQAARSFRARHRDRHGRGLRGELLPPTLPGYRTRMDKFDDLVTDSAERLHDLQGAALDAVQFAVEEIPPALEELVASGQRAPLGAHRRGTPSTVTVYRRPVEQAALGPEDLRELVHDVVVEQTAELLGVAPETLDPIYRRSDR
ncbi:metallopeptidase family protein [Paenarthrobacter sp. DKR-5]|uniref:metallopeptidase family protein n=1 Tax=Paenarthrobacter sp. DKR-5 TaxID=2835535 RepID=UPI001BDC44F7|nr:metallopeptidase family protein [Paenarthrobacter sp. DKR-5]MBT1002423.1 metallopeptidase family protein [Paenarthrobacter sp. DKR-5]